MAINVSHHLRPNPSERERAAASLLNGYMSATVKIPVGDEPDWENKQSDDDDETPLNNIFESSALGYALRQSRNAWVTTVFPKFTSKSKPKSQKEKDTHHPPHNLRFIAKCDIEIGPHIFPETSVYEVHYLSEPSHFAMGAPAPFSQATTFPQVAGPSGTYTYPLTSYTPYVTPVEQITSPSVPAATSLAAPLEPALDVTPTLIAQVNEAAATNPTLHNLLQTAAAGEASMDQLRTLGFFIQSLAAAQRQAQSVSPSPNILSANSTSLPSTFMHAAQYSPPLAVPKKPDLILEFRENHTERFLVPREIIACEQEIPPSQTFRKDIVLYTFVPFLNDEAKFKAATSEQSRTPTVIRLLNVSDAIWESIRGWVNEEAKGADAWDSFYGKAEASGPRTYLQYRLPSGDLLSQLQAACNNGYTMKSIKPAATSEATSSRRSRSRKAANASHHSKNNPKTGNERDGTDTQAGLPVESGEATPEKVTGPKRRKSTVKLGSSIANGTTGGLYFINTMAATPPVLQLHPAASAPNILSERAT